MKRICTFVLALSLLLALIPAGAVTAAEKETILIAGSDFQVSAHNTSRIEQILGTLEMHGITKVDSAFFCGDYTLNPDYDNQGQSSAGLAVLKKLFTPLVSNKMLFVQGNHDPANTIGLSRSGNNDPGSGAYGVYVIHEDEYLQYNWDYSLAAAQETAAGLKQYLDEKAASGWTKPIFVLSHVGLHWGNRTIKEGSAIHGGLLVDVLNEAGKKGLNVIFLYGHDHSGGIADFMGGAAIYLKKGDQMEVCTGEKKGHTTRTINFTYMNAGYIGYYSTNEPTCDATVTMSVFRIRGDEVIITRYDSDINLLKGRYGIHNLKSKGVWHPDFTGGEWAVPNTLEYTSSRKVTATDDVYVATPMPDFSTTAPTTSTKPYLTSTKGTGAVITKTQSTTQKTTTAATQVSGTQTTVTTTTTVTTKSAEQTVSTTGVTGESTTAATTSGDPGVTTHTVDEPTATLDTAATELAPTETEVATESTAPAATDAAAETPEQAEETPWILTPMGIALLVTGGVLMVAIPAGIAAFLVLRKKKED